MPIIVPPESGIVSYLWKNEHKSCTTYIREYKSHKLKLWKTFLVTEEDVLKYLIRHDEEDMMR